MDQATSTIRDKLWTALFCLIQVVGIGGGMFIFAAYLTPAMLQSPNSVPRQGQDKLVEAVMLFGGMGVGILLSLGVIIFISRRMVSEATHRRWDEQFERSSSQMPPLFRKFIARLNSLMRP